MSTHTLVLLRHGQSTWNLENRFTGWTDVGLSPLGEQEARQAGRLLKAEGYDFDICYTSVLRRAIKTLWLALEELERDWLPTVKAWQLNERHYGSLQGLDKAEMAAKFGDAQVKIWRRSYDTPPPALEASDPRHPRNDRRYAGLSPAQLPACESLKDTVARMLPYWHSDLAPLVKSGKRLLIAAHGNSLRALIKYLDDISDQEIVELNVPTGVPLVYTLDAGLRPVSKKYLGDPEAVARAAEAVAKQGQARR
ncbi:MAG TPA: 2,3-diphosphoglycerate-dependent phosphoglycerate mutase [Myxococcales bacterium]|nr:2,3-diphosphoglycerate-dependent phosphoglycerate mutase [Myxococcales bacterium]